MVSDECWIWPSKPGPCGYKLIKVNGRSEGAHRVVYEMIKGKIPKGLVLDHLCRVTGCVNPNHLEPVTQRENIMRGDGLAAINSRKKFCKRGHEFSYTNKNGQRICRTCIMLNTRKWRSKNTT